jgi:hypothetical protein
MESKIKIEIERDSEIQRKITRNMIPKKQQDRETKRQKDRETERHSWQEKLLFF